MKSGSRPIPTQLKLLRGNPGEQVDDRGSVGGDAVEVAHRQDKCWFPDFSPFLRVCSRCTRKAAS
jgi:hypothetical protein